MSPASPDDRDARFSDEELALILQRAAEQEGRAALPAHAGHSLAEIEAIAAEVGIEPAHVTRAAAAVRAERGVAARGGRAGSRFVHELALPGELPEPARLDLLDRARALTGQRGSVTQEPDAVTWTATDGFGITRVSVGARGGRTRIVVSEDRRSSVIAAGFAGVLFGGALAVIGLPVLFLVGSGWLLGLVVGALVAAAGTWAGARLFLRRQRAKWQERARWLGEELETAARASLGAGDGG